ncbi:MAG: NAD-dependent epimerase/dehydratase family protein, partial [Acidimicrobiia bacterium]
VEVSLFDPARLRDAVAGHDAVVNLATKIPTLTQAARASSWDENDRIRVEGSRYLVDAALAAGARVYVQESLAFVYGEHGDTWIDASSSALSDTPFTDPVRAAEASAARFTEAGGRGVVLRFGVFQAADSHHAEAIFGAARRGILLDVGAQDGYMPTIDADDAAAAVVAAVETAPAGTYDVVDDDPVTRRAYARSLARAVGRRSLHHPPGSRLAASKAGPLVDSQRVSNAGFRAATGWQPRTRSQTDAVTKMAAQLDLEPALSGTARLLLWLLAANGILLGLYATFMPRQFYDDFPFGRNWVSRDGPYNEHLVRDFGALNLALGVVTLIALWYGSRVAARGAAAGWLVFSVPHAIYHFRNLEHYDTADQVANVVALSVAVGLAAAAFWFVGPRRGPAVHSYDGAGEPLPEPALAAVRHDDLRGDVSVGGRDRVDQPGPRVS